MRNNRILIIDDNPAIHADMRKILCPPVNQDTLALDSLEAELFGASATTTVPTVQFEVDSAYQGEEGVAILQRALVENRPYAMAFVDMRMPPGWDGLMTTLALWEAEPDLQVVICTAYSDYSWDEMLAKLGSSDRLLILKKPFDTIEVLQLANALTEKSAMLEQIRSHSAMLEKRVRERTAQLEAVNDTLRCEIERRVQIEKQLVDAKEAAEVGARAKADFLANMSHEIRTPMNGVIGLANILLDSELDSAQAELANMVITSAKNLMKIINDILDLSKIESQQLKLENIDFNLYDQLSEVIDIQAITANSKGLELLLDVDDRIPATVCGDPIRLQQIVINLVGNAIKFTASGEVMLSVTLEEDTHDSLMLRFECKDTGIGIAPDAQAALFQSFVQADSSTTRKYGGTGLGLAISRNLVELMNGQIGVISNVGAGSMFWCTCRLEHSKAEGQVNTTAAPLHGRRVLIVDDNASSLRLLQKLLKKWGADVVGVNSLSAALAEWNQSRSQNPYDIILADHDLKVGDGLALISAIQSSSPAALPQCVLMIARATKLPPELLKGVTLAGSVIKPVNRNKLCNTLMLAAAKCSENGSRLARSAAS